MKFCGAICGVVCGTDTFNYVTQDEGFVERISESVCQIISVDGVISAE